MLKISALNEESEEDEENDREEVTREALEEIALQQYAKALELQRKGRPKDTLILLKALLDTELLDSVTKTEVKDKQTPPLLNLKYLCFKNIAAISFELGDLEASTQAYLDASELDDSDVTLWLRLGKVSLSAKKFDLACYSLRRGVECNPKHWPCLDNLITLLYGLRENCECISYIYDALTLDPDYTRGRLYRKQIFSDFPYMQEYLAAINPLYKWDSKDDDDLSEERCDRLLKEAADIYDIYIEEIKKNKESTKLPILTLQKEVQELTWASLGESLTHMHNYITKERLSHACAVNVNLPSANKKTEIETSDTTAAPCDDQITNGTEKMDVDIAEIEEPTKDVEMKEANTSVEEKMEVVETIVEKETDNVLEESILSQNVEKVVTGETFEPSNDQSKEVNSSVKESDENDAVVEKCDGEISVILDKESTDSKESNKDQKEVTETELKQSNEANKDGTDLKESSKECAELKESNENNVDSKESSKECTTPKESNKDKEFVEPKMLDAKESSDNNSKNDNDNKVSKKNAGRRRGSDLSFLEQWEWCTKRRSSRKKGSNRNERNDENINVTLTRMLSQFISPEDNQSLDTMELFELFNNKQSEDVAVIDDPEKQFKTYFGTEDEKNDVETFLKKYIGSYCDIITMLDEYVETLSGKWDLVWPKNLGEVYLKANNCAKQHYDPPIGYDNNERLRTFVMINLLHLEILVDKLMNEPEKKNTVDIELLDLMRMLCSRRYAFNEDGLTVTFRYLWARCHSFLIAQNSEFALDCLYYLMNEYDDIEDSFILHIPNFLNRNVISRDKCQKLINNLEQNKRLSTVISLYDSGKYESTLSILVDAFKHCQMQAAKKEWSDMALDWAVHLITIVESFWSLDKTDESFTWAIISLHESLNQYLLCPSGSPDHEKWSLAMIKILVSIEHMVKKENTSCLDALPEKVLSTFIQDIVRVINHQYDDEFEEIPISTTSPWIILHFVLQRLEDCGRLKKRPDEDSDQQEIPMSIMILFIGHECLGRKGWCFVDEGQLLYFALDHIIPRLRSPSLSSVMEIVGQHLEQSVCCLFGHPTKKNKLKYLMDHNVSPIKLDWKYSEVLFELYRPYELPEFNSYRLGSITIETEQLFQRMLSIMPQDCKVNSYYSDVMSYIEGKNEDLPKVNVNLPCKMKEIYYLLADFYFKNNELIKALKYYAYDIVICNDRFDSWAGMALARSSLLETKLNSCEAFKSEKEYLNRSAMVEKCYKKAIEIDSSQSMLWVEYGAFVYGVHSFCSRMLKQGSESLSMDSFEALETRKENMLKTANKCFIAAHKKWMTEREIEEKGTQDERWLHYYMLGKISEKNGDPPEKYLGNYISAGKFLQENNATYPNKISYNNPQFMSVEALEIHYRIHASILKYMEQHENKPIFMKDGKAFKDCLNYCAEGPFSTKKKHSKENSEKDQKEESEKPNENKRPATDPIETESEPKKIKRVDSVDSEKETSVIKLLTQVDTNKTVQTDVEMKSNNIPDSSKETEVRRTSQESTTTTTNTVTSKDSSSDSSSSSSSDDSSSDSSSDLSNASTVIDPEKLAKMEMSPEDTAEIISACVHGLEDCVSRFAQHYKALYRLAHFYLYNKKKKNIEKCRDLLLATFTAENGNKLPGLFSERKNTNFFSSIWRIPTSEIDRPGSFATHMNRCVLVTMEVLKEVDDHKTLLDLSLLLHRTPDAEKKYLRDTERLELSSQAMSLCIRSLKGQLSKFSNQSSTMTDPVEKKTFSQFIVDVYKGYQRVQKHCNNKSQGFAAVLIDCYKLWHGRECSKNDPANILELSIKHSQMLITSLRNQAKESAAAAAAASASVNQNTIGNANSTLTQRKSFKMADIYKTQVSVPTTTAAESVVVSTISVSNPATSISVSTAPISSSVIININTPPVTCIAPMKNTLTITSSASYKQTQITKSTTPVSSTPSLSVNVSKPSTTLPQSTVNNFMPYLSNMMDPKLLSSYGNMDSTTAAALSSYVSSVASAQYQNDLIRQLMDTNYLSNISQSYQQPVKPVTPTSTPKMKDILKALQTPYNYTKPPTQKSYKSKETTKKTSQSSTSVNAQNVAAAAALLGLANSPLTSTTSLFGTSLDLLNASKNVRNPTSFSQIKPTASSLPTFSSPQSFLPNISKNYPSSLSITKPTPPAVSKSNNPKSSYTKTTSQPSFNSMQNVLKSNFDAYASLLSQASASASKTPYSSPGSSSKSSYSSQVNQQKSSYPSSVSKSSFASQLNQQSSSVLKSAYPGQVKLPSNSVITKAPSMQQAYYNLPTSTGNQSKTSAPISPNKSLQEMLAERQKYSPTVSKESATSRAVPTSAFHSGKIPSSLIITKTTTNPTPPKPSPKIQDDIIILDDD